MRVAFQIAPKDLTPDDPLADGRFAVFAKARVEGKIDSDCLFAAPEFAELYAHIDQGLHDPLADDRVAVAAKARVEGVVNRDFFLAAAECAERDALFD